MRFAWFGFVTLALATFGLYGWYGTLHPCEMLKKDILRGAAVTDGARADGTSDVGAMLNQLLGETLARPMAEAWLADKSPGECARSLVRYHTEGEL